MKWMQMSNMYTTQDGHLVCGHLKMAQSAQEDRYSIHMTRIGWPISLGTGTLTDNIGDSHNI
jgi:hypothetical protein